MPVPTTGSITITGRIRYTSTPSRAQGVESTSATDYNILTGCKVSMKLLRSAGEASKHLTAANCSVRLVAVFPRNLTVTASSTRGRIRFHDSLSSLLVLSAGHGKQMTMIMATAKML